MRINTKRSQAADNSKSGSSVRGKAPVRKKASRKIGKNRISGRRIMATVQMAGKIGGILLLAACILSIGRYVYNSETFILSDIAIYGCMETDPKVIEDIVWGNSPGNILKIDLQVLKEQLEQEKWVKNVEIRRILPSGLVIYIQERIPSVILEMNGQLMIADDDGILLDRYEPRYGRLDIPIFKGIVGKDPDSYRSYQEENTVLIRHALNMLAEIESEAPQYLDLISEVNISNRNNYVVMFVDDTVEFQLGNEDYRNRLRKLSTNDYKDLRKKLGDITTVDLRPKNNKIRYKLNLKVSGSPDR